MESKEPFETVEREDGFRDGDSSSDVVNYKSTPNDIEDMDRLGRKQVLIRHFRLLSTFSFVVILQGTWEWTLVSLNQGLIDGGLAGMVWSFLLVVVLFLPIVATIAEMASMAPTSGGQYHWISEFAPQSIQKPLSFFAGWQATLAWQAGNAAGPVATGTLIQTLVSLNIHSYKGTNWQGTLIVIANVLVLLSANMYGTRFIPFVQNLSLILYVLVLLAILIPLWALAPHNSASTVFTEFQTSSHYSSTALSFFVCQLSAVFGSLGSDGAAHMAEEVRDGGFSVSRAIFWGYVLNGILGIILVWTICFAIPDVQAAVQDPSGYPYLYALNFAMSTVWSTVISSLVLVLLFVSNISALATTARETFAFARDGGLPFSSWLARVDPVRQVPINSMIVSAAIAIALSLIYIGSPVAYYAIASLNIVAIMCTYTISMCCLLWRRIKLPNTIPPARWSLGRWGVPINSLGVIFSVWFFFWAFWPQYGHVTPSNFNWGIVMFVAVTIVSLEEYVRRGGKYNAPVSKVKRVE